MRMNYNYLKVFYTICKHENISKAAKELNVTQPALSRIISTLEQEYNVVLFHRYKGGVKLTQEGLSLYEIIKNPFKELEKAEPNLTNKWVGNNIIVHIGATAMALECYLFKHLDSLRNKFPFVTFRITTGSSDSVTKMLEEKKIDFAFITSPSSLNNNIEIVNIHQINNILVAPISYKNKLKGINSLKLLQDYPFILLDNKMQFREQLNDFFASLNITLNPVYEPDSSNLLLQFVQNDCGLTFLPEDMALSAIENNKIFKVNIKEKLPPRYISFIIKKDPTQADIIKDIKKEILRRE